MLGALAGLCGWLWKTGLTAPAAMLFAGAVAIVAVAYAAASRRDVDGTTEVAALVVLAAGLLAGTGAYRLASAIIALEALLLVEKSRLHSLVRRIDDTELRAGVRFAVMACVILPLLPKGPYGPFGGLRPRELWALVLFFSALSFLGHVARRLAGPGHGYLVTGLLGGIVSSTNVTFTFARLSRRDPAMSRALALRRRGRQRGGLSARPGRDGGAQHGASSSAHSVPRHARSRRGVDDGLGPAQVRGSRRAEPAVGQSAAAARGAADGRAVSGGR